MYISLHMVQPILAIAIGLLILLQPKMAHYLVAIFLIVFGILELAPMI
ncbi:Protein of unknown function [Limimonas halophila]|uniref:DUF3096 domain-containing protein n=1 Tax=Limimonas halophila TaxID=1082479 RepID=A0A1G7LWZ0_9PROT|nr:DUF3096 domain-containing protein [Limimonas halophila]SDF53916.1 Protein of unknown function [Limimonas halophila]